MAAQPKSWPVRCNSSAPRRFPCPPAPCALCLRRQSAGQQRKRQYGNAQRNAQHAAYTAGKFGQAISLNGSQSVIVPNSSSPANQRRLHRFGLVQPERGGPVSNVNGILGTRFGEEGPSISRSAGPANRSMATWARRRQLDQPQRYERRYDGPLDQPGHMVHGHVRHFDHRRNSISTASTGRITPECDPRVHDRGRRCPDANRANAGGEYMNGAIRRHLRVPCCRPPHRWPRSTATRATCPPQPPCSSPRAGRSTSTARARR